MLDESLTIPMLLTDKYINHFVLSYFILIKQNVCLFIHQILMKRDNIKRNKDFIVILTKIF